MNFLWVANFICALARFLPLWLQKLKIKTSICSFRLELRTNFNLNGWSVLFFFLSYTAMNSIAKEFHQVCAFHFQPHSDFRETRQIPSAKRSCSSSFMRKKHVRAYTYAVQLKIGSVFTLFSF